MPLRQLTISDTHYQRGAQVFHREVIQEWGEPGETQFVRFIVHTDAATAQQSYASASVLTGPPTQWNTLYTIPGERLLVDPGMVYKRLAPSQMAFECNDDLEALSAIAERLLFPPPLVPEPIGAQGAVALAQNMGIDYVFTEKVPEKEPLPKDERAAFQMFISTRTLLMEGDTYELGGSCPCDGPALLYAANHKAADEDGYAWFITPSMEDGMPTSPYWVMDCNYEKQFDTLLEAERYLFDGYVK